jgi:hypothetical protein
MTWIVMGFALVVSGHVWDRAVATVGAAGTFHQMAFRVTAFTSLHPISLWIIGHFANK